VSHAVASTLDKDYGYPPSKLVAVHSGVDTDLFAPSPHIRELAREAWGIPETAFVFGTLGRLSPMKNLGQLVNAFSKLCECHCERDIRLVIVGDGPLRSSLETLVNSTGVRERVVFGGFSATPQSIYPAFDVFCFPSTTGEALGIALLEAMACGCPPIAAAVGGVPEILNDPRFGWLIRSGDENALLSAMRLAAELDDKTLQQIGANARERVLGSFEAVDRWEELVSVIETAFLQRS
jgi:glycosyltransferase involved in cell wall biosynthesis